jgi:hypothetical protein
VPHTTARPAPSPFATPGTRTARRWRSRPPGGRRSPAASTAAAKAGRSKAGRDVPGRRRAAPAACPNVVRRIAGSPEFRTRSAAGSSRYFQ